VQRDAAAAMVPLQWQCNSHSVPGKQCWLAFYLQILEAAKRLQPVHNERLLGPVGLSAGSRRHKRVNGRAWWLRTDRFWVMASSRTSRRASKPPMCVLDPNPPIKHVLSATFLRVHTAVGSPAAVVSVLIDWFDCCGQPWISLASVSHTRRSRMHEPNAWLLPSAGGRREAAGTDDARRARQHARGGLRPRRRRCGCHGGCRDAVSRHLAGAGSAYPGSCCMLHLLRMLSEIARSGMRRLTRRGLRLYQTCLG